jgi:hypothetical protein
LGSHETRFSRGRFDTFTGVTELVSRAIFGATAQRFEALLSDAFEPVTAVGVVLAIGRERALTIHTDLLVAAVFVEQALRTIDAESLVATPLPGGALGIVAAARALEAPPVL